MRRFIFVNFDMRILRLGLVNCKKDYSLEEMQSMNDAQNNPLGKSDSPAAIAMMDKLRKGKV